jgi:hypothetical protein
LTALARRHADEAAVDGQRVHASLRDALRVGFLPAEGPACPRCGFPARAGRCDLCGGLAEPTLPTRSGPDTSQVVDAATSAAEWPATWVERLTSFVQALAARPATSSRRSVAPARRSRSRKSSAGVRNSDGSWTCGHCGHHNSGQARVCFECGYAAPERVPEAR